MHKTTSEDTLILPPITDENIFVRGEKESWEITEPPLPAEWAEENFFLVQGAGYSQSGKISLYPWQVDPVNSIYFYDRVILCGPVQTGKSLIAEIDVWYVVRNIPMHAMICYAKKDTVEDVFQDRISPTIKEVPCLKELWDGNNDNLTKSKIKLRNCIMRVASAQVQNDIATFSAGLIYASEVCKYKAAQLEGKNNFDVIKLLRGRQEAYGITGKKKEILESSPKFKGDILHKEMFHSGVLNLVPKYPCPTCGTYQQLVLEQIKEVPSHTKEFDHDPERIRREEAAYYECNFCGNSIQEKDRIEMGQRVVWATKEEIVGKDGTIPPRVKKTAVSFQWSRLVDYSFKFSECLARFFEASRAGDPVKLVSFLNEDMGEFGEIRADERSSSWLMSKITKYEMKDVTIPDGVMVVLAGVDTQDNGFYYVLRGFGVGKESWLLDCDFIRCDMPKDKAPEEVLAVVKSFLFRKKLECQDGRILDIEFGLWDRGGHKANFVDYLTANLQQFSAYVGSPDKFSPLIKASKTTDIYYGNTDNLSKVVDSDSMLENWHLPEDIPKEYLSQFVKQYDVAEIDRFGNEKIRRVKGGADHYRDCENMIQGCIFLLDLDKELFNGERMDMLRQEQARPEIKQEEQSHPQNDFMAGIQERWSRRGF